jgi:hypothetical protein
MEVYIYIEFILKGAKKCIRSGACKYSTTSNQYLIKCSKQTKKIKMGINLLKITLFLCMCRQSSKHIHKV